ncbi:MAG TPA: hypothetical protein VEC18_01350, partial [Myxococcota bacterium]|nr:hypothetical protein [Myxococcota bacterium]
MRGSVERSDRLAAGSPRPLRGDLRGLSRATRARRIAGSCLCAIALLPIACRESARSALDEIRAARARHRLAESIDALRGRMDEDPSDPE